MKRSHTGVAYQRTKWNIFRIAEWNTVWMLMPKAASTAIRRALATQLVPGVADEHLHHIGRFQGLRKDDAVARQREGDLVIGSTRHPVTRLASCWYDKLIEEHYLEFRNFDEFRAGMSFVDFVDAVAGIPDGDAEPHFRSLSFDLVDDGRVIPDIVVDQATLARDWNRVRASVAWRTNPHVWLPDLTRQRSRDWRSRIGDVPRRTLQLIHERYAEDFAAFGYSPDLADSAALITRTRAPQDATA